MKKALIAVIAVAVIAGGGWLTYVQFANKDEPSAPAPTTQEPSSTPTPQEEPAPTFTFGPSKKSAHYVSNTPAHGAVLDAVPPEVVLTFNFDLSSKSTISITRDGQEVGSGEVTMSADRLTMSRAMQPNAGPGLYTVTYDACWPDGSCHDGQFQFGVR